MGAAAATREGAFPIGAIPVRAIASGYVDDTRLASFSNHDLDAGDEQVFAGNE
jgi:hypothetical protein